MPVRRRRHHIFSAPPGKGLTGMICSSSHRCSRAEKKHSSACAPPRPSPTYTKQHPANSTMRKDAIDSYERARAASRTIAASRVVAPDARSACSVGLELRYARSPGSIDPRWKWRTSRFLICIKPSCWLRAWRRCYHQEGAIGMLASSAGTVNSKLHEASRGAHLCKSKEGRVSASTHDLDECAQRLTSPFVIGSAEPSSNANTSACRI